MDYDNREKRRRQAVRTCGVLIVEDNAAFRRALAETLHGRFPSIAIVEAKDGSTIWRILNEFNADLIFMDIRLPGENGFQLTKRLKTKYPEAVVLVLTSYDFPEYQEAARLAGADHFLSKHSATIQEIADLVETLFQGRGCSWANDPSNVTEPSAPERSDLPIQHSASS